MTRAAEHPVTWGIIPAAGIGSRIQPLAFSKELLPVGTRLEQGIERPRAVSEYVVERMIAGGAERLCFVISTGKSDILEYYGGNYGPASACYVVQPRPEGLCDALFRARPLIRDDDVLLIGLPDTVWFPSNGFDLLPNGVLSLLLFSVKNPELFDSVELDVHGNVERIRVKEAGAPSEWIWGAFKMPGYVFRELARLWRERAAIGRRDEYIGTLMNAYIANGNRVLGVQAGRAYVDVGTMGGYRRAIQLLEREYGAENADETIRVGIQ
ncbi:MAG TPA: sugar phosphate nucleotidyltransferase [Bdellovibrionota bacterium]|nr:sugar phosphate nucleotidyltransferase [Bdellovibrionota bacterium]